MHQACLFFFPTVIIWCCFLFMFPLVVCGVPPLNISSRDHQCCAVFVCLPRSCQGCSRSANEFLWGAKCRRVGYPSFFCGVLWNVKHLTQIQGGFWHGRAGARSPAEVPAPQPWARSSPRAVNAQWATLAALGHAWLLKHLWIPLSFCSWRW